MAFQNKRFDYTVPRTYKPVGGRSGNIDSGIIDYLENIYGNPGMGARAGGLMPSVVQRQDGGGDPLLDDIPNYSSDAAVSPETRAATGGGEELYGAGQYSPEDASIVPAAQLGGDEWDIWFNNKRKKAYQEELKRRGQKHLPGFRPDEWNTPSPSTGPEPGIPSIGGGGVRWVLPDDRSLTGPWNVSETALNPFDPRLTEHGAGIPALGGGGFQRLPNDRQTGWHPFDPRLQDEGTLPGAPSTVMEPGGVVPDADMTPTPAVLPGVDPNADPADWGEAGEQDFGDYTGPLTGDYLRRYQEGPSGIAKFMPWLTDDNRHNNLLAAQRMTNKQWLTGRPVGGGDVGNRAGYEGNINPNELSDARGLGTGQGNMDAISNLFGPSEGGGGSWLEKIRNLPWGKANPGGNSMNNIGR